MQNDREELAAVEVARLEKGRDLLGLLKSRQSIYDLRMEKNDQQYTVWYNHFYTS